MSYKVGLILSFIFVVLFFALGVDLITIQYAYSDLDAKSTAISYKIAKYGTIDDYLISNIETNYNVEFTCLNNCSPMFGDVVLYKISTQISTIVTSQGPLTIAIERRAVIGYYA